MFRIFTALLPKEPKTSTYIKLAESLFTHLDTREKRERVVNFAITAINRGKGKMTTSEWASLGGKAHLGVIGGNGKSGEKKTEKHK